MLKASGAEIVIRLLERENVQVVAGIPGGANLPLYDALGRSGRIRHVLARHEQGAGFIAHGIARSTGGPGVCFATSGPGATNLLTAVADAKLDSVPLVCFTGQVPMAMIGTDAFQEVDTVAMSGPVAKRTFRIESASELLTAVPEAFRLARSGRPGPVLVDLPKDVQTEVIDFPRWPDPSRPTPPPAADLGRIQRAAEMIDRARRPVLYVGGGVIHSGASAPVRALAERAGIPTTMTLMGLGALPSDHELSLGMLGMHGARFTNLALEECDLLIAVGARFDDRATGRVADFCPAAAVIHVDIDAREIGKLKVPTLGIRGDAKEVLGELRVRTRPQPRERWRRRIEELRAESPLAMDGAHDPGTPYGLIGAVARAAAPDSIVTTDVGQHQMWVAQTFPFQSPRSLLTSGGLGTMGFGLPAAIGAALAHPDRPVICFTGDGSLLMNIQELAVAAEEGVDLKLIVMNNGALGLVNQQQDLFYGGRRVACEFRGRVDFARVAAGFGIRAVDLAGGVEGEQALAEAMRGPGPVLVNAPIHAHERVFPMVPPGAPNREMIGGEVAAPARP